MARDDGALGAVQPGRGRRIGRGYLDPGLRADPGTIRASLKEAAGEEVGLTDEIGAE